MSMQRIYVLNPEATAEQLKDGLMERLSMLEALVNISQTDEFLEHDQSSIANYLWVKTRLLFEIRELFNLLIK